MGGSCQEFAARVWEGDPHMGEGNSNKKNILVWKVAGVLFFVIAVVCIAVVCVRANREKQAEDIYKKLAEDTNSSAEEDSWVASDSQPSTESAGTMDPSMEEPAEEYLRILAEQGIPIPEKKVDFEDLQENVNKDIYAWLYIPDSATDTTEAIDFPVLQHPTDNSHYLNYNLDGSRGYPGCIYTENYNKKDFTDPLTVIYGHVMDTTGSMFAGLHRFRDEKYLEEHPYIYIYLPDQLYVYEIFAAYEYTDEHLLYGKDYENEAVFTTYIRKIEGIRDMDSVKKEGVELSADDKILTLSTCITGKPNNRYLVQGVLINGE